MIRYNNYHKHTHYSNVRVLDCVTKPEDYMKRAKELGHTTYFTTEHGFQGNIFEAFTLCQQYGLKCIYGVEAYYTKDINDKTERSSYHIMLIAMTEKARKEINGIMSIANTTGFYYKPRIGMKELLSLTPNETIVTTACIASKMFKGDDWEEGFLIPLFDHFKDNLYLEIQSHKDDSQAQYNKRILEVHNKYGIKLIHGNDSHYIKPEDSKYRELFLKAKGIEYPEESDFTLDYPDSDEILRRYKEQGVIPEDVAISAIENTLVFDNAEGINLDKEFKIPKITDGDSNKELKRLINEGWVNERKNIPKEKWNNYLDQIRYEYKIIEDCGMADYFILDHNIVKKAVSEYGAVLTRTGRGSAVSFYINKLLGLTEVDRIDAPITLYPTRFMSAERILQSRSIPDIDLNFRDVKPVIKASKDILGEDGIYYMVAYKPLQESSAFRLWCKANGLKIEEYDDVAKNIEDYYENSKWKQLIEESKIFRGVIESIAPSPCSFLLSNNPISKEIGLIKVGEEICCCLDGYNCDCYKWLKNDYLTVMVYELIDETYKLIGRPIDNIRQLLGNCDDKVWDVYANSLTSTINQCDSDYDKQILSKYKPKSLSELSAYVAAIRPGFSSLLNNFIERKDYSTGVKELDKILEDSFHYLMYQESIMKYLTWLGIEEKGTYDIIKKIAKKKFTEEALNDLKKKLISGWVERVGTEDGFAETWKVIEDAASYSFNASHSLCVALDSLYGAYLKSHYPLEYYTVAFNSYNGDMDRTDSLTRELPYFGIKILPIKFRHSRADYNMDKETNSIYKGMASIKYMNRQVSEDLYALRNKKYNSFIELLNDFTGDTRQREILIKLDFFEEFGKPKKLLEVSEIYDKFYGKSQIKKTEENYKIIPQELMVEYATKECDSIYKFDSVSMGDLLSKACEFIPDDDIPLKDRINSQNEFLGYITEIVDDADDCAYIMNIDAKYSPKVTLYDLKSGKTLSAKIKKNAYKNNPVDVGDVIKYSITKEGKWTKEGNNWVQSDDPNNMEDWLGFYGKTEKYD